MVKKVRYQENRTDRSRGDNERRERWVFEPLDWALLAAVGLLALWLQWLLAALAG
ncbi:hypothetical protein [Aestuariivirga sp.]|uniref:hypothetical protein n=1 Tax=Aestuariivirga sp. TaxID=2650926 RepID=UPI00391DA8F5